MLGFGQHGKYAVNLEDFHNRGEQLLLVSAAGNLSHLSSDMARCLCFGAASTSPPPNGHSLNRNGLLMVKERARFRTLISSKVCFRYSLLRLLGFVSSQRRENRQQSCPGYTEY